MNKYIIFLFITLGLKLLSMFVLQNFLTYMSILFVIVVFGYTVYQMARQKLGLTIKTCVLILCMVAVISVPTQTMTVGKFHMLKPLYQHAAEQIAENIDIGSFSNSRNMPIGIPERILLNGCEENVACKIIDEQYTISFTKHRNFFVHYAYVYFSEPEAVILANEYDSFTWLEPNKWALIKYY